MRIYQYEDIQKVNQALGSFKKNEIPVKKVKLLTVGQKLYYFILTDAEYKPKKEKKLKEKKTKSTGENDRPKKVTKKPPSK